VQSSFVPAVIVAGCSFVGSYLMVWLSKKWNLSTRAASAYFLFVAAALFALPHILLSFIPYYAAFVSLLGFRELVRAGSRAPMRALLNFLIEPEAKYRATALSFISVVNNLMVAGLALLIQQGTGTIGWAVVGIVLIVCAGAMLVSVRTRERPVPLPPTAPLPAPEGHG
jgi:hypothetical protein